MSPTSLARVIVTEKYQLTLLHVSVLIAQLTAHLPSVLLSRPNASLVVVGNWHFLVMWRVASASQITPSLLEHASIH